MVDRSVNRQSSTPGFLVTVLFLSEYKNHYIAMHFREKKKIFIHIIDSAILVLSQITGFFSNTTIDISINYFYCNIIVSQSSSLFVLRYEGNWCVLALNISNIGLRFMEIMKLFCVASWLAGFLCIQVLLGIFQTNSLP